jgi:type II restriction/modification system DNA methylase subunit YeeA
MREALSKLSRYIATPCTSKHRIFVRLRQGVLPDHQLIAIARDDDYAMGVLHSKLHEVWARRSGTQLREASSGCRYTPTTTYETFPFPWPLGTEPGKGEPGYDKVMAIMNAARDLVSKRDVWLSPTDPKANPADYTLTKLYNSRPTWLTDVHSRLDQAVKAAYGWADELSDAEILERLLELNLAQSGELKSMDKNPR